MVYNISNLFYYKKDKACFRRIFRALNDNIDVSDVSLAKSVSSVITHILIDMEGSSNKEELKAKADGYRLYDWLDIQVSLLKGEVTVKEVLSEIQGMLGEE